jgi:hypothetical protein
LTPFALPLLAAVILKNEFAGNSNYDIMMAVGSKSKMKATSAAIISSASERAREKLKEKTREIIKFHFMSC